MSEIDFTDGGALAGDPLELTGGADQESLPAEAAVVGLWDADGLARGEEQGSFEFDGDPALQTEYVLPDFSLAEPVDSFQPSQAEVEHARQVLSAAEGEEYTAQDA